NGTERRSDDVRGIPGTFRDRRAIGRTRHGLRRRMRICHVSPHLPPDQAANALLPVELAGWARARGDEVTLVSHEPVQGRAVQDLTADRVVRIPRKAPESALGKLLRLGSLKQARLIHSELNRAAANSDLLHLHSNGLIVEVAAAWA